MSDKLNKEPMLEIYLIETNQMLEQLEACILSAENEGFLSYLDEMFRLMHSLKGSSSMMLFNNIANLAHSLEDLFDYFRNNKSVHTYYSLVTDIVLESIDFFKNEISKLENDFIPDGNASNQIEKIKRFLFDIQKSKDSIINNEIVKNDIEDENLKCNTDLTIFNDVSTTDNLYRSLIFFDEDCENENLRAFTVIHGLSDLAKNIETCPEDIMENSDSTEIIRHDGLQIIFTTQSTDDELNSYFKKVPLLKDFKLEHIEKAEFISKSNRKKEIILNDSEMEQSYKKRLNTNKELESLKGKQSTISVNISKLDSFMDLVGELVIAEAMVTRNPELVGLELDGFHKAARHLRKISNEIRDSVMSIRMVPLDMTFQKMNRIVRDMSHKLNKEVYLEIIGEETEVDKNIIENISDPIMHIIRNSMDHGLETNEERVIKGKPEKGKITLEAKNSGGDVIILIKDDGRGLNKEKILKKAIENDLLSKPESEMTDKEIYSLIFLPGFSTKIDVTEFSGRGVGLDIVIKNIKKIRGTISIDSFPGEGMIVSIKLPLTLAIINGMTIRVGKSRYTIPITAIRESFKVKNEEVIEDPDGNEMILVRGKCYPIIMLHKLYSVVTDVTKIGDGIITMIEEGGKCVCLFSDALIGEQQVVVKPLPKYIKKVKGVAGCTLLGDGSISLILDAASLIK